MTSISSDKRHVILFPFMSKGHTIPFLQLARFLLRHDTEVTFVTTPANRPFILQFLGDTTVSVIDLPFPCNVLDIPTGIESTDKLPTISLVHRFALATQLMQFDFEQVLKSLPGIGFIVSDGFLWWTLDSAAKFGIPRFAFYGTNSYSIAIFREVAATGILQGVNSNDELVTVTPFPWMRVCKNDFILENDNVAHEFRSKAVAASKNSRGLIVNSFYELESAFVDHLKAWCVGPLCLGEPPKIYSETNCKPSWVRWLDCKLEQGSSVLYVEFGTQAEISGEQLKEIAIGLEESMVNFLWVSRKKDGELADGFEERVKERGLVVREWVDQREILNHKSVQGFLSHCGWNSVLESICAGVPILAWPMIAEQPLNAKMVVEEIKVGLRVETCDGSVMGFVKWGTLKKMVKELIEGEKGKEVRKNVKELEVVAKKATEEGGSSWRTLELLIDQTCEKCC